MEKEEEEKTEISPKTIEEIKEEEKRPKTLAEIMKEMLKAQERKKQTLYDEFLPGK